MEEPKNTADTENAKNVIEELPKGNTSENRIGFAAKFLHNITETGKKFHQQHASAVNHKILTTGKFQPPERSLTHFAEKFNSLGIENDYLSTFLDKDSKK